VKGVNLYYEKVVKCLTQIRDNEKEKIEKAADLLTESIVQDKLIHVFGTGGHSSMAAEEMFWRAGGLVHINAILEQGVNLSHGALRSNMIERLSGYAKPVLDYYQLKEGEVIILVNAYGINSLTIDTALEAKKRKMKLIAITSPEFAKAVPIDHPARHPSKKNLIDLDIDVLIDNHMPVGDAVVEYDNFPQKVSPVSTIVNAFVLNSLVATTVEKLLQKGIEPPVWRSANMPGGDEANKKYVECFFERVKHL
jgi:uncharacterized phosphosugar-binding protein